MRARTNNGRRASQRHGGQGLETREAESTRARALSVGTARLGRGWERWPLSLGQIGYSFKRGELRGDVGRLRNPETGLIEWYATWHVETGAGASAFTGQDLADAIEFVEGEKVVAHAD